MKQERSLFVPTMAIIGTSTLFNIFSIHFRVRALVDHIQHEIFHEWCETSKARALFTFFISSSFVVAAGGRGQFAGSVRIQSHDRFSILVHKFRVLVLPAATMDETVCYIKPE